MKKRPDNLSNVDELIRSVNIDDKKMIFTFIEPVNLLELRNNYYLKVRCIQGNRVRTFWSEPMIALPIFGVDEVGQPIELQTTDNHFQKEAVVILPFEFEVDFIAYLFQIQDGYTYGYDIKVLGGK